MNTSTTKPTIIDVDGARAKYVGEPYQHRGRDMRRSSHLVFHHIKKKRSVSWRVYSDNASESIEVTHYHPHSKAVEIDVSEYHSVNDRDYERRVMLSLDMEDARALRDMLTTAIDNHAMYSDPEPTIFDEGEHESKKLNAKWNA